MDGTNAEGYANAFATLVDTAFRVVQSPQGVAVLLFLLVMGLGAWVYTLNRGRFADIGARLQACEQRHEDCKLRERRNLVAIATLHGIICSLHEALPADHPRRRDADHVRIPTLAELLSGEPAIAAAFSPDADQFTADA